MIVLTCVQCGKNFEAKNYRQNTAKYCALECKYLGVGANISKAKKGKQTSPNTQFKTGHRHSDESRLKISVAKQGQPTWNKGKTLTDEHVENLRLSHIGKMKGNKNGFKNGMIPHNKGKGTKTSLARRLRVSKEYKIWRKAVFERDNYVCVLCGQRGGKLNADHINKFADFPELRCEVSNGRTLCEKCHVNTDNFGNKRKKTVSC